MLRRIKIVLACTALAGIGLAMSGVAMADTAAGNEPAQAAPASSHLQVTGSRTQFSIEADHADLQSVLNAIFVQAGKQFDLDSGVSGQITLKLSSQQLETILASVCKQTFLKYHLDANNSIYHFEQDVEAVKAAFTRIDTLNTLLRQQLRDMGLELPGDAVLDNLANNATRGGFGASRRAATPEPASGLRNGAGQGGGGRMPAGPQDKMDSAQNALANGTRFQAGQAHGANTPATEDRVNVPMGGAASRSVQRTAPDRKDGVIPQTDWLPQDFVRQFLQANGVAPDAQSSLSFQKGYQDFLRQNNLIAINTNGAAVPVSDVFAELSRQSGVTFLLDPLVPRGSKFRINLKLPACSLNEALNIVLPPAHLKWRIVNGAIWITPTPDFQIFYGSTPVPNVIYGNSLQNTTQQRSGLQSPGQAGGGLSGGQNPGQGGKPN